MTGQDLARLTAPAGRHFYGHGAFSAGGDLLFTTENDYANARGLIGVWDARNRYRRLTEFPSGGIGPHDIKRIPGADVLVVANGGIETHPETGRTKLNLPTMRANLTYLGLDGTPHARMDLAPEHQRNSIRHLAVAPNGSVAFAMQWQGDLTADLPLLGLHRDPDAKPQLFASASVRLMQGYLGSVALDPSGTQIATTSPRSGLLQIVDTHGRSQDTPIADVCGVAPAPGGFIVTAGTGLVRPPQAPDIAHDLSWDNHLIAL